MQCAVHVYVLNEHFSQEYADQHYGGKDSEMNRKYDWEDELVITSNVKNVETHRDAIYVIRGTYASGDEFEIEVKGMLLFDVVNKDGSITQIAASESIVDHFECSKNDEQWKITIFLKDYEPMANPIPGIYIASKSFPSELITE